jgi:proteasome activator subunit 4
MLSSHDHQESTRDFPDWVANFIGRVIQLLENLPDEGAHGDAGGTTESKRKSFYAWDLR